MRTANAVLAGLLAAFVLAAPGAAEHRQRTGYLKPGDIDVLAVLPPAPVAGDPRYDADRAIFRNTRKLVGTPRWDMAVNDADSHPDAMLRDFSCAVGVDLTPANAPKTVALVEKVAVNTQHQTWLAKEHYKRLRPFLIDDGKVCQSKEALAKSYDYPSGHTTWGWAWAMVLSDIVPSRATEILARGRAYGESRIVCGAHNASAVDGGRLSATVTFEAIRNKPAYRHDLQAARAEISALRKSGGKPTSCAALAALVEQNVFVP